MPTSRLRRWLLVVVACWAGISLSLVIFSRRSAAASVVGVQERQSSGRRLGSSAAIQESSFPGLASDSGVCRETEPIPSASIYVVTPTYARREQVAEMTRLAQTLMHVRDLHWVVVEDAPVCSRLVGSILSRCGIPFTHLTSAMPAADSGLWAGGRPKGVSGRRAGLKWVLEHHRREANGVVYFADDDNTYDLDLFEEIRGTTRVSVFPVGFVGWPAFSSPLVSEDGRRVVGFSDFWFAKRKFAMDMAGFAVSAGFVSERGGNVTMPYDHGNEEDGFLRSLNVELEDLEPVADGCTRVLAWHTKTVAEQRPTFKLPQQATDRFPKLNALLCNMRDAGMISVSGESGYKVDTCADPGGCDLKDAETI